MIDGIDPPNPPRGSSAAPAEAVIHREVAALLQRLSDEHGVQVRDITVSWSDFSEIHGARWQVHTIEAHTFSRGSRGKQ